MREKTVSKGKHALGDFLTGRGGKEPTVILEKGGGGWWWKKGACKEQMGASSIL